MKKLIKFCVAAGCVTLLLGVGVSAGAVIGGASLWDLPLFRVHNEFPDHKGDGPERIERKDEASEEYRFKDVVSLEIEAPVGSVFVKEDPELQNEILVQVFPVKGIVRSFEQEGGSLELGFDWRKSDRRLSMEAEGWNGELARIYVPEGHHFREVSVESDLGTAELRGIRADRLELHVDLGQIVVENGIAETLELEAGMGSLMYEGSVKRNVEAECDLGQISMHLDGNQENYNYRLKSQGGSILLGGTEYAGLASKEFIDNQAAGQMELECSLGTVEIEFDEK